MNTPRFRANRAIAWYLGEDEREVERNRRYQPTRTPCPVYTVGNEYLAASPNDRRPRQSIGRYEWEMVTDSGMPKELGWTIWRRKDDLAE